jgi:hypothetical protein
MIAIAVGDSVILELPAQGEMSKGRITHRFGS